MVGGNWNGVEHVFLAFYKNRYWTISTKNSLESVSWDFARTLPEKKRFIICEVHEKTSIAIKRTVSEFKATDDQIAKMLAVVEGSE